MGQGTRQRPIVLAAPAKVNLCLAVGERLPDGYHALLSLAAQVSLEDQVEISPAPGLEVVCDAPDVPAGSANLAHRAAVVLGQAAGRVPQVRIRIDKRIPVAAGLAGGSADAAAVLVGLAHLWRLDGTHADLAPVGRSLGADVPFCLLGGAALMEGAGERLTPLDGLPPLPLVLAAPRGTQRSTASAYAELDRSRTHPTDLQAARARVHEAVAAWREGDLAALSTRLFNDLEALAFREIPDLEALAATMRAGGALGIVVSGSGPTLVVLARDPSSARSLAQTAERAGFWAVPVETRPGAPWKLN